MSRWLEGLTHGQMFCALGLAWLAFSLALGLVVGRVLYERLTVEDEWPWCNDCRSYHHSHNPTCRRLED